MTEPPSSSERVVCVHSDRCAGCPGIEWPYGEQLARKRRRVVHAMSRYPALRETAVEQVAPAEPRVGYRTRAKLMVAPGAKVGLYAKGGGHEVVDIPECRVLAPALARAAAAVRGAVREAEKVGGVLAPAEGPSPGALRAVDLREVKDGRSPAVPEPGRDLGARSPAVPEPGRDLGARSPAVPEPEPRVLVTLVVQRERHPGEDALREAAARLMHAAPEIAGVAVNVHEGEAPQVLGSETRLLAGVAVAPDRTGASVTLATFGSFVQAHRGQAARVHAMLADAVRRALPVAAGRRKPRVLDLFGGSGAMALALAAEGAVVHVIESFGPAADQVRAAAEAQGLDVRAERGDAAAAVRSLAERGERFDAVVVNPPRRGLRPEARDGIARLRPPLLAYVSCDPDTLARDLDHLSRLGYAAHELRPVDMIPLTDEVETVTLLRPAPLPLPRAVYTDDDVFVAEKPPHEPTTPQGEHEASLLARVRQLPGHGEAVPVHRLDIGTSGLVVFARTPARVPSWQAALRAADAQKVYVAAVRGVTSAKGSVARPLRDVDGGAARPAKTRYRRLFVAAGHSVVRVVPEQGRTHQIRRHLAALGHPVLGDARYGHAPTNRYFEEKFGLDRTFLHCARIELTHPKTGERLALEVPVPGDLCAVAERAFGQERRGAPAFRV